MLKSEKGVFMGDGHQHLIIKPQTQLVLDLGTGGFLDVAI